MFLKILFTPIYIYIQVLVIELEYHQKVYLFHEFHSESEACIRYTFIPHRLIYFKCLFGLILMIITDN